MRRSGWHILRDGPRLTLSRRLPPRFDIEARTSLPDARRARLAHQVRQDVWRALQNLRGFTPVIEITRSGAGLSLRAGGQVDGPVPPGAAARLEAILSDPACRQRWLSRAARRAA